MKREGTMLNKVLLVMAIVAGLILVAVLAGRLTASTIDASRADASPDAGSASRSVGAPSAPGGAVLPDEGIIRITDELFPAAYDELYERRDEYYGREIELSGYVLAEEGLGPGGFLIGRDYTRPGEEEDFFIGYLAFVDGKAPAEGSSIRVTGRLEPRDYASPENGTTFTVPAIRVDRVYPAAGLSRRVYPR